MTQGSITWTNTNRRSFPTDEDPLRSRGGAGFQARPQHAAFRAPTGETCRRCMGSYYRRQLFAPLLALQAPQGAYLVTLHRVTDVFSVWNFDVRQDRSRW